MTKSEVTLNDKYTIESGRILINGNQALVRLPVIQYQLDKKQGLNTAGYISGYRGSPLGGYDSNLWKAKKYHEANNITFQPGVNEDLAATAIWGTQLLNSVPDPTVDGVFSIWYGKGPGVDRCGDVFKHANYAGTHENGGVLVVYGDDHPGKSSTVSHQSEQALAANLIPSLYPADVSEFIDYGVLGWALSRYAGLWVGFKCVNETVEQTATIDIDLDSIDIKLPNRDEFPADTINQKSRNLVQPQVTESNVINNRLPLVHRFVLANNIDQIRLSKNGNSTGAHVGIVTAGKSYNDVMSALNLLDIDKSLALDLGLSVYKVGCIWPLEPTKLADFADQQDELVIIEEKRSFLEEQVKSSLFGTSVAAVRVVGKKDQQNEPMLPSDIQIEPLSIAFVIAERLRFNGITHPVIESALEKLKLRLDPKSCATSMPRTPYFCSGCPHNTSTKLPQGSIAMAGIGCHAMATFYRQDTLTPAQMGGEGLQWVGLSKYTETPHVFQNLGDGTYYHSGLLAIRAAVASKTNITYKILYNDAVAMTGGQPVDGPISVAEISQQVAHEGITKCVLVTDSPEAYNNSNDLAQGIEIYHRDRLDMVQTMLSKTAGCTVLIYEQTCAAEKRRRRKRGLIEDPKKRLFINEDVCEGCSDCSVQSTCVSIQPIHTNKGIKRKIDQSSCNKDYSCNKGFCPSFITVIGGKPKKSAAMSIEQSLFADLPKPTILAIENNYNVMIAGIGGSGVITVGAILAMAAHIDGKACSIYDMTGLSQKNGAVYSHVKFAESPDKLFSSKIDVADSDFVMAFDLLAALGAESAKTINPDKTKVLGNSDVTPTVIFQLNPLAVPTASADQKALDSLVAPGQADYIDATNIAKQLLGDTIGANLFVVGYALQKGLLPVSISAVQQALTLNGVSIEFNLQALNLGRLLAYNPDVFNKLSINKTDVVTELSLSKLIEQNVEHLTKYQNSDYAQQYKKFVETVITSETEISPKFQVLSRAVATNLAKLMSYKDEYEVARMHSDPDLIKRITNEFEGDFNLKFNLAPPLFSKRHPDTGLPVKKEFGQWMLSAFKLMAKFKFLRGTKFDIFGYSEERQMERQLINDYRDQVSNLLTKINRDNLNVAVEIAELPQKIKGFGHIKERNIKEAKKHEVLLMNKFLTNPSDSELQFKEVS